MNIETTLQKFYDATKIPLQLFDGVNRIINYDTTQFDHNPAYVILQSALQSGHEVCYSYSPEYLICGLVRINDSSEYVLVGPVVATEISRKQVQNILTRMKQPIARSVVLMQWFNGIPLCDVNRFHGFLKFLDYSVNEPKLTDVVYIPYQESLSNFPLFETEPYHIEHFDDSLEKEILSYIEYGRTSSLEVVVNNFTSMDNEVPMLNPNLIRSFKNVFIISTGLASRAAMKGGLNYDTANALTTNYLIQVENLNNYTDILLLLNQMFLDFARRVAKCRTLSSKSLLANKISKEIYSHLYEKITPTMIAEHLKMNCTYLCTHFKQETGKTITAFIQETKITESKRLLETSQMPIIQISTQLGFSTQNYFHSVFKKITGMTPTDFRNKSLFDNTKQ